MTVRFFEDLAGQAKEEGLEFLLIGGNAVNAYGYQRTTLDADLLIRAADLERWQAFWEARGYRCIHLTDAFCQYASAGPEERFPVDLMMVSDGTFEKLSAERQTKSLGGADLEVPAPLHLIALKLHALRNEARALLGKDLLDVVGLVRACGLDPASVEFQAVLDRYATESVRRQIIEQLEGKDGGETEGEVRIEAESQGDDAQGPEETEPS
jgi:hypothetical protein